MKQLCAFVTKVVITQKLSPIVKDFSGAKFIYKMLSEAFLGPWERCSRAR